MPLHLPLVDDHLFDDIGVATPCTADWNEMRGDERVRHCGQCRQNVYDLSTMTRAEALATIRAREGRMCVRLFRRTDGTVVTSDCWERLRAARRRGTFAFVATLVLVCVAHLALKVAGFVSLWSWVQDRTAVTHTMGKVAMPPPVPPAARPDLPPPLLGEVVLPPRPAHVKMGQMVRLPRE
jgi:hypothetical protein